MLVFGLSATDDIAYVGAGWDQFALANGGAGAVKSRVLGRSLWEFVKGPATRRFLEPVLAECRRSERRATMAYRCDSPQEERLFCQHFVPMGAGALRIENRMIRIRPHLPRLPALPGPAAARQCSVCFSTSNEGQWWARPSRIGHPFAVPRIWAVCPACVAGVVTYHPAVAEPVSA
jgi:hypothetical protein